MISVARRRPKPSSSPTPRNEGEEAEAPEATGGNAQAEAGAQVFASNGCGSCHTFKAANSTGTIGPDLNEFLAPDDDKAGIEEMIVDPNAEIAEGYSANVMPQTYGQDIPKKELEEMVQFLIENSPLGARSQRVPAARNTTSAAPPTEQRFSQPTAKVGGVRIACRGRWAEGRTAGVPSQYFGLGKPGDHRA